MDKEIEAIIQVDPLQLPQTHELGSNNNEIVTYDVIADK